MALYKFGDYLQKSQSTVFDVEHKPGDEAPCAAIYRCAGCGREVVSDDRKALPAKTHHQHTIHQGPIRWRLVVAVNQNVE